MPFMRKFWKPKQSIPTTSTLPAVASPTHPSAHPPAPAEPLADSVGRHLDQPSALFTSPPFVNANDADIQPTKLATAFGALSEAYDLCSDTIVDSERFVSTEFGKEVVCCIEERLYGLSVDLETIEAEQKENEEHELIMVLRQVEDRVRRLRSEVLQAVADHPSLLRKKMKDGRTMTYEEKIQSELRKVQDSYKAGLERSGFSATIGV